MKRLALITLALLASGCATSPEMLTAAIAAQSPARPTLTMTCPAGGCSLEYTDPRDRNQVKLPTNGYDAMVAVTGQITGLASAAVVPGAMAHVAVRGFNALKGSGMTMTTTMTDRHDVTDDHSATATPTIVTQPPVQVVTQPPVQVVTQPPPLVVTQPAVQVVNPIVIQP